MLDGFLKKESEFCQTDNNLEAGNWNKRKCEILNAILEARFERNLWEIGRKMEERELQK